MNNSDPSSPSQCCFATKKNAVVNRLSFQLFDTECIGKGKESVSAILSVFPCEKFE